MEGASCKAIRRFVTAERKRKCGMDAVGSGMKFLEMSACASLGFDLSRFGFPL